MKHKQADRIPFDIGGTCLTGMRPECQKALMDFLGKDGGYVMAPAHEIQKDIPAENIVAWVETVKSVRKECRTGVPPVINETETGETPVLHS